MKLNFCYKRVELIFFVLLFNSLMVEAQIKPMTACEVTAISPTSLSASYSAATLSPSITVTTSGCTTYTVTNSYAWISYSKSGLSVTISVTANTGAARTGYVYIGGKTLTVTQACGLVATTPLSVSSDRNNLCYNPSGNITLSETGGSGTTFRWFTGSCGGTSIGTGTTLTITVPTATTTYYGRWEATCSNSSCKSVTVVVYSDLTAGSIGSAQSICYNTAPANLTQLTSPSGGSGTYTYQWQNSTDNSTWTDISGATSSTYSPGALTSNSYFRRNVTSGSCGTVSSNSVFISVYNQFTPGTPTGTQSICYNTIPSMLNPGIWPEGGSSNYSYQWQSSLDASTWNDIQGTNSPAYSPGAITSNTYFRRNVTDQVCGTLSSTPVLVTVVEALSPGSIGNNQTSCNRSFASELTEITSPSGGNNSYTFKWQNSVNGSTWSDIPNAISSTYSPGVMSASTYFRRVTMSGPCTPNSNSILITVYPVTASITGGQSIIDFNTSPGTFTVSADTGSNFSYLWYKDNISTGITTQTYAPGSLTETATIHCKVTCNECGIK